MAGIVKNTFYLAEQLLSMKQKHIHRIISILIIIWENDIKINIDSDTIILVLDIGTCQSPNQSSITCNGWARKIIEAEQNFSYEQKNINFK
jgi:hypothetical protein